MQTPSRTYRSSLGTGKVLLYDRRSDEKCWRLTCELHGDSMSVPTLGDAKAMLLTGGKIEPSWCGACCAGDIGEEGHAEGICPPDCKVDHDAIYAEERKLLASERKVKDVKLKVMEACFPGIEVTAKKLLNHSKLFGSAGIQEIADMFGVVLPEGWDDSAKVIVRKVKQTKTRKQAAQDLIDMGHRWSIIEEVLDLPTSVSKRLREQLGAE